MTSTRRTRWAQRFRDDRGSEAIATAIVVPLLLMLLCMAIAGGRIVTSGAKVDAAAEDAARAASISRTYTSAQAEAAAAAARTQDLHGLQCSSTGSVLHSGRQALAP
ncbi:TadE/TadG family type IV pilus assembly protein, partial [Streptomyces sp. NPDC059447]|uniref:TadE/TadG family type IV pilus assembly protein n=1 Tax=Streptomyces sp. NPDC059447 TaxID=3346834 RepID=UPI00369D13B2